MTARAEGEASFDRPEPADPVEVCHLIADVRDLRMELAPVLAAVVAAVDTQAKVLRDTMVKVDRWFEQPRTQVRYTVWDRDWEGRKVDAALFGAGRFA